MARMIGYLWWHKNHHNDSKKAGEHWIQMDCSDDLAEKHLYQYLRNDQFRRRGFQFDAGIESGDIVVEWWDISKYAESKKRFFPHSSVDEILFEDIGYPDKDIGSEFKVGDWDELCCEINDKLITAGQPLRSVGLSTVQYEEAFGTLEMIANGSRTLLCEWCARSGKTILGGVLSICSKIPLTIVATYALTSFASFKKDLMKFEQFKNLVIVDAKSPTYKQDINNALLEGKQVVVFLSMHRGGFRKERIGFLFGLGVRRLVLIDEADFGIHREKQADLLIEARDEEDVVILMTGTNGDRAVHRWKADGYRSVVYPELILHKRAAEREGISF